MPCGVHRHVFSNSTPKIGTQWRSTPQGIILSTSGATVQLLIELTLRHPRCHLTRMVWYLADDNDLTNPAPLKSFHQVGAGVKLNQVFFPR